MKFIYKLERKFGPYAIPNLTRYLIFGYVIGYALEIMAMLTDINILGWLTMNPALILQGQVWRLFTWVITPPSGFSIFTFVMLFFYYSIGNTLEMTLGRFRYNLFIFSGIFLTTVGVMLVYIFCLITRNVEGILMLGYGADLFVTTYYLCLSMFLAFAVCYPDMRVMLYFIIPVKMKWLAWLDVALLAVSFALSNWVGKIVILISMLNFLIFFLTTRNYKRVSPQEIHRKRQYYKQVQPKPDTNRHKCAICGRTEESDSTLEFRYCSKCNGAYEYCQEHLFTHEHVK